MTNAPSQLRPDANTVREHDTLREAVNAVSPPAVEYLDPLLPV